VTNIGLASRHNDYEWSHQFMGYRMSLPDHLAVLGLDAFSAYIMNGVNS
jgi:hypothetical protein